MRALALALGVAIAAGPAVAGQDGKIAVPNLIGKTADEAQKIVDKAGFLTELEIDTEPLVCDGPKDNGKIQCQDPAPGKLVDHYAYIHVAVYHAQQRGGRLLREDLAKLIGLTVDQAKAELKKLGHDGAVNVETEPQYVKKCGADKVCEVEPAGGTGIHDDITLYVNPKLTIAAPPP